MQKQIVSAPLNARDPESPMHPVRIVKDFGDGRVLVENDRGYDGRMVPKSSIQTRTLTK